MDDYLPNVTTNPSVFSGSAVSPPYSGVDTSSFISQGSSGSSDSSSLGNWLGGLGSMLTSVVNNFAEDVRARRQRKWSEKMMDKQNEWNLEMWNKANQYNSAGAQVQRMKDAGLNPMNYQPGQFGAESLQSAQPNGYTRGTSSIANPMEGVSLAKSIELADAQIAKTKSETESTTLDNEFARKTMDAREEGFRLANSLSKEQIKQVKEKTAEIHQNIKNLIEEAKTEQEKRVLMSVQEAVGRATERQIIEMLPLQKELAKAQSSAQRAQAACAWTENAFKKKLYTDNYINDLQHEVMYQAEKELSQKELADAQKLFTEWRNAVHSGTAFDLDEIAKGHVGERVCAWFANHLFRITSATSEAIAGPLAGIVK